MTLLLSEKDIDSLADMKGLIQAMEIAHVEYSRGDAVLPMRSHLQIPKYAGSLDMMPGYLGESEILSVKILTTRWNNPAAGLPIIHATVLLVDPQSGCLIAVMDGSAITALRTAAVSGLATRYLARKDAHSLAIIGAGRQAKTHLWAMIAVCPIQRIFACDLNMEKAQAFKYEMEKKFQITVDLTRTVEAAVKNADITVLCTTATEPVVFGQWLREGMHINSIASATPQVRELDSTSIQRSKVVVDSREAALVESGDLLIPISEGKIETDHIHAEIGEIAGGSRPGRTDDSEITIYKSLGLAIQDAAAANWFFLKAREQGCGKEVDL